METKLNLIAERARKDSGYKFNNLMYLLNVANLRECFYLLKKDKASGIDGVSLEDYEKSLEANLTELVARMKRWSYSPKAARRVYIPKADGRERPLGIPSVEDKVVQMGIARILEAIYEADFLECSYGFRPNRSCHDALSSLDKAIMKNPVNHVIDADIKGFFDNVNHGCLMKFLEVRISDKNMLRLIVRFLKSGIMEDGEFVKSEKGTPQGGIISPILANVYLHYALDLWMEKAVRKHSRGYVEMVRYADDFIICVQYKDEAKLILDELKKRLQRFGLELAEDKTRIIEFGRYAKINADNRGEKPATFNFLGFTHFSGKSRKGAFKVGRKTNRKKFATKMKEMNNWLKGVRNLMPVKEWWPVLCAKLMGHYQYYGVSGNYRDISSFYRQTVKLVFKWLNRRSQKISFNWSTFAEYIKRHTLPKPKIYHNMYTIYGYSCER